MRQTAQAFRGEDTKSVQAAGARRACIALAALLSAPAWANGSLARFRLPAEPFPQAILDFYHQSGVQAIYAATPRVERIRTRAVSGVMSSAAALARMLQGTGLTFVFDSERSVIIRPASPVSARQGSPVPRTRAARPAVHVPSNAQADGGRLREVEVTGSFIRGVQAVSAPLLYIRHQQLAGAAYATVQDALYELPLVSMDGPREDLGVDDNYQYGAGINLRGLGVGATLVLVNGYRQPLGGLTGDFVDVSTIPWSAVKRIEVLPDGASALYGSDAIAGVVNIIMRNRFKGAETDLRYTTAPGGRAETMVSQLLGTDWPGGHAMLAYEYSDATPLTAADRPYAANADKVPYGGTNYDSYYSDPGNILDPLTLQPAYGIPADQDGKALSVGELTSSINLQNPFAQFQIFPERTAHEFYAAASEDLLRGLKLFVQARYTRRETQLSTLPDQQVLTVPASNPFYVNPYAGAPYTLVAYSFQSDFGPTRLASRSRLYMGTLGGTARLGAGWQATLSESDGDQSLLDDEYNVPDPAQLAAALADPNPATAFDPFGDGSFTSPATLAIIRRDYRLHSSDGIEQTELVADGPLVRLPAGEAKLAVGVQRRSETLHEDVPDPQGLLTAERYGRHVWSVFSQLDVPLVGDAHNRRATPRLTLGLAGRYDHYSDFGGTFNPTARLRWTAAHWLKLRGSWGRSFRAPKLDDLYDTSQNIAFMTVLADPNSPTGRSLVLGEQGANPDLRQETARTWTVGLDMAPGRGAEVSLTYYAIDYFNRIEQPAADDPLGILAHASEWAPVITFDPTQAQIAAVCESPVFVGSTSSCLTSRPAAIVDLRLANLAATRTSGLDLEARERFDSRRRGHFTLGLAGNYVFRFLQSVTPASPPVSILNTVANPLALRLRGTAGWSRRGPGRPGWSLHLALNYTGAYRDPSSTKLPSVSAWTTVDARVAYRMAGVLESGSTDLSLNVVNILNRAPPFVDSQFGYDIANFQALGRVLSVNLSEQW